MVFRREKEMTGPARRWLESRRLLTKPEFATPWGICDLVGVAFDPEKVAARLSLRQSRPIGPPLRIGILLKIPDENARRGITPARLAAHYTGLLSRKQVEHELEHLIKGRFVTRNRRGSLRRMNGWMPMHETLIAVELKLRRVAEALRQAKANLYFAEESYVGLPAPVAKAVASGRGKQDFVREGVGILAVYRTKCKIILEPGRNGTRPDPVTQTHCLERFWRSRPRDSSA